MSDGFECALSEINRLKIDLNRCNAAYRDLKKDVVEIQDDITAIYDRSSGDLKQELGWIIGKCILAI